MSAVLIGENHKCIFIQKSVPFSSVNIVFLFFIAWSSFALMQLLIILLCLSAGKVCSQVAPWNTEGLFSN